MKQILEKAGFTVDGKKVVIPEGKQENIQEYLERAVKEAEKYENVNSLENSEKESEIIAVSPEEAQSTVEYFEKIVSDQNGNDMVVRLSIVKQSGEDNSYDRLVNISYINKETGVMTSDQIFGYIDGFQFDNDVLPSIISGFQRNIVLSGKEVSVNEVNSTKCYLNGGNEGSSVYLEGYNVDGVRSLLDYNREHDLTGDENNQVDLNNSYDEGVIEEAKDGITFEGEVTDTKDDETKENSEDSYSQDGPKMVKTLGEMPTNNHGLSNSVSLTLFLAIDIVAIFVGFFLLICFS